MKATEITRRYHEAWTVAMPTRLSPVSRKKERLQSGHYPGASGEAFPAYLKGLWTAFPDFHLELLNAGEIEPGVLAHHWRTQGTNTGQGADGSEPTGRAFTLTGSFHHSVRGR